MKSMKKVELVIEAVYITRLLELFKQHEINAYTIIKDIEGRGGHGLKTADDVSDVFTNIYVFTLCEENVFISMKEEIRTFVKKYGGKCIITDVMVILS
ncbi:MAG: hypothetical protein Q8N01_04730 [Sulfuricurvum sp.]|nr:hypothetical protein [Sulfuricurvum sp.]MDP3119701.1 hypothetical protein [Sulfuricurvum sp.]